MNKQVSNPYKIGKIIALHTLILTLLDKIGGQNILNQTTARIPKVL
jgi:hypothetical protein